MIEVPFTNLSNSFSSNVKLAVNTSNGESRLFFKDGSIIDFRDKLGVPLKIIDLVNKKVVIFREIFTNAIYLLVYDNRNKLINLKELTVPESEGIKPIFRQAFLHDDDLVLVLYDNSSRINFIERYEFNGGVSKLNLLGWCYPLLRILLAQTMK